MCIALYCGLSEASFEDNSVFTMEVSSLVHFFVFCYLCFWYLDFEMKYDLSIFLTGFCKIYLNTLND